MTPQQLAILNALVTFAAENVPGGLSEDEQEVARIVGAAALLSGFEAPPDIDEQPTQVMRPRGDLKVIFAGRTRDTSKLFLYQNPRNNEYYIRYDGSGLWALDPDANVEIWEETDNSRHLRIRSRQWSGHAIGTRFDLVSGP